MKSSQARKIRATTGIPATLLLLAQLAVMVEDSHGLELRPGVSGSRVALVIVNAYYEKGCLRTSVHEARQVSDLLRSIDFDVIERTDATREQILQALRDLKGKIAKGGTALVCFAGHGVQVRGQTYFLPIDHSFASEDEAEDYGIATQRVVTKMKEAGGSINIVILDPGNNDLYVGTFLYYLNLVNIRIELLFKRVRNEVARGCEDAQVPSNESSFRGDSYTVPIGARSTSEFDTTLTQGRPMPDTGKTPREALTSPTPWLVNAKTEREAIDLYRLAYGLWETDPVGALANIDKILSMLPPNHEYHRRAKVLKAKIQSQ